MSSSRPNTTAILATGIAFALTSMLWYAGCQEKDADPPVDPTVKDDVNPDRPLGAEPKKMLEGWKKPKVAVLLSAEMHGYIEPCGCSETQSGGLARRADLVRQLETKGWDVVGVDLGGLPRKSRAERLQSRLKFQTVLAALTDMNYAAIGLGPEELKLERGESYTLLTSQLNNAGSEEGAGITPQFLSANLTLNGDDSTGVPLRYRVVEKNGVKIGIISVLGSSVWKNLFPSGANTNIEYVAPAEGLKKHLPELKAQNPDLMILLSHSSPDESEAIAKAFPDFDLVLSAGYEEPRPKPLKIGKTLLTSLGHKGKKVGVLGFYPDAENRVKLEVIELDKDRFKSHQSMIDHMATYQDALEQQNVILSEPPFPHPSGTVATYVGAEKCGECHKKAFTKWKTTRHSHAFESLAEGRKNYDAEWVSRINDPECLACHVTGWDPQKALRYTSGYESEEATPHLKGQQCENCHGPGSEHTRLELQWKEDEKSVDRIAVLEGRQAVKLSKGTVEKTVCIKCHDYENSPKFDFDKYWLEVAHPWRD